MFKHAIGNTSYFQHSIVDDGNCNTIYIEKVFTAKFLLSTKKNFTKIALCKSYNYQIQSFAFLKIKFFKMFNMLKQSDGLRF